MTASGTAGHGDELEAYLPLASLGAVVAKSLAVEPWPGNAAPRVHQTPAGMLNSVGLQGPGVAAWLDDDLPRLPAAGPGWWSASGGVGWRSSPPPPPSWPGSRAWWPSRSM